MYEQQWMIYGANGYTGEIIAREAVKRGQKPLLAGRSENKLKPLAEELGLNYVVFSLDSVEEVSKQLSQQYLVLHCAGPFSATAEPMMKACIASKTHYLDITGEISVYEMAHSFSDDAKRAGIILIPGVGFDVIPTDCVAAKLKQLLPDATHLTLGFDSASGLSPGTAKTSIEGLAGGGKVRENGVIKKVPLAFKTRKIDFGDGEKLAMTIPWGDVATSYYTTGIPNVEVYIPAHPKMVKNLKKMNKIRYLLGLGFIQNYMKSQVDKKIKGPNEEKRNTLKTYVWGEVSNDKGETKTVRIATASGYALTVTGALAVIDYFCTNQPGAGYITPSVLMGADLVTTLPGSGEMVVS
jgi:short subunit dehydrogenase-like uncharacterized protein